MLTLSHDKDKPFGGTLPPDAKEDVRGRKLGEEGALGPSAEEQLSALVSRILCL